MRQRPAVNRNRRHTIRISDRIIPTISLLSELSPGPLIIFNKTGKVAVANRAAARLLGKASIIGTDLFSIFSMAGEVDLDDLIQNGEIVVFEQQINGTSIRFTIRGIPYLGIGQVFPSSVSPSTSEHNAGHFSKEPDIHLDEQGLNEGLREAYCDLLWSIYQNSVLPTFTLRRDGEIAHYNDAMFALTGYTHEEVHNVDLWMNKLYKNKEYREKVIEDDRLVRSRAVSISKVKYLMTRKNGEQRYVEFMVYDVIHEGRPTDLQLVQVEDVNEREVFANSLRTSETGLSEAQRIAHLGSWEVDLERKQLTCSQQMHDMLGISGREIDISLEVITNCVHPEDRDLFSQWLVSSLLRDDMEELEFRIITPTGSVRIMNGQSKVMNDESGRPVKLLGIIQDITERRLKEEEYRYLLEEMGDAYFVVQDERFVLVNKKLTELLDMKKRQIIGKNVRKTFAPEMRRQVMELHRLRLAGEQVPMRYNAVVINGSGERVPVSITAWVTMFRGRPAVSGIMVNITDRINRQYEYAKVQEEERRRLARAIHDDTIQELLVINHGIKDIISNTYGQLAESVSERLSHLGSILEQTTNRLRDHTLLLRPSILDDLGMLPSLKWLADRVTSNDNINTEVKVIGNIRRLPTEVELALFRVAQEALNNVRKHSKATIAWVEVVFSEARVTLRIEDNGVGFRNPVEINHFVKEGKLGLLGMTERIVLLGGTYNIHSVPGKGTSIKVTVNCPSKIDLMELSETGLEQAGFLKKA